MTYEQKEGKEFESELLLLFEKLSDSEKKTILLRKLESKILWKESKIKLLQYHVETLKTIKSIIEKTWWGSVPSRLIFILIIMYLDYIYTIDDHFKQNNWQIAGFFM